MKTIAFFNNKGGVGKTSLVYHLAWMFADRGVPVLAVDLDPQSNLTSMFLDKDRLETLWGHEDSNTISDCLRPLMDGTGDIDTPHLEKVSPNLALISGNLALAKVEDELSKTWLECVGGNVRGYRFTTAFYRMILKAVEQHPAQIVLIDVGPNLGAINRAALIATDYVVFPLAPDLFSLQGLRNLGPTLQNWRKGWDERKSKLPPNTSISLPTGRMNPIGYVVMQHGVKGGNTPVKAYQRWLDKIPAVYREYVLDEKPEHAIRVEDDPYKLAQLKHYRSLMPLAQEGNKPIFHLKPADGAIGAHVYAVKECYDDFLALAGKIAANMGVPFPDRGFIE
jgi:cellulose biosynthesis protein BcsQ